MRKSYSFAKTWRAVLRDTTAGVTTIATLAMPVVIGAAGLAFDLNRGYQQRVINQRVADMGALAAALAYSSSNSDAVLTPTARDIALANGLSDATVSSELIADFPEAGDQSVRVTISRPLPFLLASVIGFSGTFDVSAASFASVPGGEPNYAAPCYLALNSGSQAIFTDGGADLVAPNCSVAAVGSIYHDGPLISAADVISGSGNIEVAHGSNILANSARFAGSFTVPAWYSGTVPPDKDRVHASTSLSDPWIGDADRLSAMAKIGTYTAPPTLNNPSTPGGADWDFSYSPSAAVAAWRSSPYGNTYVVPTGNYNVGRMQVAGGIKVIFNAGSTIRIANGMTLGGQAIDFNGANLYINGGVNTGWGGVDFGNGALWIGSGTVTMTGNVSIGDGDKTFNSIFSLGGGSSFTMGNGKHQFRRITLGGGAKLLLGNGDLIANDGIFVDGGSILEMGSGNVVLGPHSDGNALNLSGSSQFLMGTGNFSANGNVVQNAGGARMVFGPATNHYINGNLTMKGFVLFGAGRYTVNGSFSNGTGSGGTTWPYTSSLSGRQYGNNPGGVSVNGYQMAGVDVTFVLSGNVSLGGGTSIRLEAPTMTTSGGAIKELLLSSATTAATPWGAGAQVMFSGAVHLPNSHITMNGGNSTVSGTRCMSVIADKISVTGGAVTASSCEKMEESISGGGSGSTASIRLVG